MYTVTNYKTKKALKEAVKSGEQVSIYSPGFGDAPTDGTTCVEGPHYPEPHRWYASVVLKNGLITKVS
jgi:hypothetical protein